MKIVSRYQPLHHYRWGGDCEGWNFVGEKNGSVKPERMPPGSSGVTHVHREALSFFYILSGTATFLIDNNRTIVRGGEGLFIEAGRKHRIANEGEEDPGLLLCSPSSTVSDCINCNHEEN